MAQHKDSTSFRKWSFENTAHIMSEKFPRNHILIIRPARYKLHKLFASELQIWINYLTEPFCF